MIHQSYTSLINVLFSHSEDYYEVDEREKLPNSEQKKWESERLASAMYKFGAKDAIEKQKQQEEYDLLLDDQIEFIQAMTMDESKKKEKDEPKISETQKKRMDIKETKESLPVYPFRDDLIAAIREHQVRDEKKNGNYLVCFILHDQIKLMSDSINYSGFDCRRRDWKW